MGPTCKDLINRARALNKQLEKTKDTVYSAENLKTDLSKISGNITSVIISAHDGNGDFYGELGKIKGSEFLEAFKNFPPASGVKSLYLFGCRSAMTDTFGSLWKTSFPNASYIMGYQHTGYLKDNNLGHKFIKNAFEGERDIVASKSTAEALAKFKKISPADSSHGTAACITIEGSKDPLYISSTEKPALLADKLGCKTVTAKLNQAIEYMKCIEKDGSTCPLDEVAKMSQISDKGCDFSLSETYDEAIKFRNKYYVLKSLLDPNSSENIGKIFSKAPASLQAELKLEEPPTSFADVKKKLLAIKNYYEQQFDYEKIKNLPIDEINKLAKAKDYIDRAWLAVSNLDMAQYNDLLGYYRKDLGGPLRAQAFRQQILNKKTNITYEQRIQTLEVESRKAEIEGLYTPEGRSALKKEITTLKSYTTQ
jgi:hypothetical protein